MLINVLLFNDYETLDALGPIQVLGNVEGFKINCVSLNGGLIRSAQGVESMTSVAQTDPNAVFLVPGGRGTRALVSNTHFLTQLKQLADASLWCLSVCTGAALLAKAGILDGITATSNKKAWDWVINNSNAVNWKRTARWCVDGKFYTSSGVSAGIDMALGFVADRFNIEYAQNIAQHIEYNWHNDKDSDPFA
ncbi:DJ-1/PfpI family protein [Pseudomonas sp. F1_0610]|uniref:DJ-1/PfpI family protein n=1 Tax=Pseudomonas sp. F1_0610 TaxID=3114284 RepID=UPI0039C0AE5D